MRKCFLLNVAFWALVSFQLKGQNVGIGTAAPTTRLHVDGETRVGSTGLTAAAAGAGAIRWNGTVLQYSNGTNWLELLNSNGAILNQFASAQTPANFWIAGNGKVDGYLDFGVATRQMINLLGSAPNSVYGIGVQNATQYFRTDINFAWFRGGVHSDVTFDPGGGTVQMVLNQQGSLGIGTTAPTTRLHVTGEMRLGSTGLTAAAAGAGALRWNGTQLQVSDGTNWLGLAFGDFVQNQNTAAQAGANFWVAGNGRVNGSLQAGCTFVRTDNVSISEACTGNRFAYVDMVGDDTYTDYGFRVLRGNTGPNAVSVVDHRGTGPLQLVTREAGDIEFSTTNALRMKLSDAGNLGIGVAADAATRLQVQGSGGGTAYIGDVCSGAYIGIKLNDAALGGCANYNILSSPTDQNLYLNRPTGFSMNFREGNADQMIISSGGNVGMGVGTDAYRLRVRAGATNLSNAVNDVRPATSLYASHPSGNNDFLDTYIQRRQALSGWEGSSWILQRRVDATAFDFLSFNSHGNGSTSIGINTLNGSEANAQFDKVVFGANGNVRFGDRSTGVGLGSVSPRIHFSTGVNADNTDPINFMRIDAGADISYFDLWLGDNPLSSSQDYFRINTDFPGNERFVFRSDGVAFKPGGGSWATLSDANTKNVTGDYSAGLAQLLQVRPVTFTYKEGLGIDDPNKVHIGVVAQELQRIAPEMVGTYLNADKVNFPNRPDHFLTVDPSAFTYMLINSVKELNQKLEVRTGEVESLRQELEALRRDVRAMQAGSASAAR
jgi:hypothetical protein